MFNQKIILASKSPRRSQMLKEAGFQFVIKTKEVEENYPDDLAVEEVPEFLAQKKARAAKDFIQSDEIILAADCIVEYKGIVYGKPTNYDDAVKILEALSGSVHRVISGVCLLSKNKEVTFSSTSFVHMDELSREEIDFYIKKYQPYDKAGAYAIQEWIGLCKISKIEGLYSNIVGLPMQLVYKELKQF